MMKLKGSLLQCAGSCASIRKPQYCSRECQKADWKKHWKWCKKEPDLTTPSAADEAMLYSMHMMNDGSSQS
ncbi:uncharacterized protein LACBIDRAFT_311351 [Laccaria bicolor S238N-H82]|uniref:Predicted protein n=1 Tax=Laccaria bicolor (strain S238N-H82 / ATCC MYA-4686) TaxID=486041 RepID=B0CZT5_LACBS|nr:uncharacterized protein LACBIDRAFT_311351 [Laccaria bicolor S238N-H82]EDR12672.1 predicted protein [Laccaria bicolor S238N-H82]|eukprot:XP_001876936.1 predicted protein [Laccaria bicolor S238N-H82]